MPVMVYVVHLLSIHHSSLLLCVCVCTYIDLMDLILLSLSLFKVIQFFSLVFSLSRVYVCFFISFFFFSSPLNIIYTHVMNVLRQREREQNRRERERETKKSTRKREDKGC